MAEKKQIIDRVNAMAQSVRAGQAQLLYLFCIAPKSVPRRFPKTLGSTAQIMVQMRHQNYAVLPL